ncbi:MAG TPA: hypothetical protein VHC73_13860 [Vitreimonas sp.]|nr:hypothetical protein [Vitreimonas sp.]
MNPDVGLRIPDHADARQRLTVSDGTTWADDFGPNGFEPNARIAKTWRALTSAEIESLTAIDRGGAANTIALVAVSDVHRIALQQFARADSPSRSALNALAIDIAAHLPASHWRFAGAHDYAGLSIATPRGATTNNEESGRRVGLHLDNFDRLPFEDRHRASNRICINIGQHARALQFAPYSVATMLSLLRQRAFDPQQERSWPMHGGRRLDLARAFLSTFPDAPVFALLLSPGEAYIAPTENIIHDGLFNAAPAVDATFTIRGHIEPC